MLLFAFFVSAHSLKLLLTKRCSVVAVNISSPAALEVFIAASLECNLDKFRSSLTSPPQMLGNQIKKLKCALSTSFQSRMFDVTLGGDEV